MSNQNARIVAAHHGNKKFFPIKPCAKHPESLFYTSSSQCVECSYIRSKANSDKVRAIYMANRQNKA